MTDRQYPIGRFILKEDYTKEELENFLEVISSSASKYSALTENLGDEDLAKTYREGSWNVRQLVHHVSDIAFIHYFRLKKAVTESDYNEVTLINMDAWSATQDSLEMPIAGSLSALEAINERYAYFAARLSEAQLASTYFHPMRKIWFNQKQALAMSVWHLQHHLAHIELALGNTD